MALMANLVVTLSPPTMKLLVKIFLPWNECIAQCKVFSDDFLKGLCKGTKYKVEIKKRLKEELGHAGEIIDMIEKT